MSIIIKDKYLKLYIIKGILVYKNVSHKKIDQLKSFILPHSILVCPAIISNHYNVMVENSMNHNFKG